MADLKVGAHLYVVPDGNVPRSSREAKQQRQAAYLAWLLLPKDEREPRTKTEMAARLGVTIQALLGYERDPAFADEVRSRLGHAFKVDRLPALFEALYVTATDPDNPRQVTAARTLLEWFGRSQAEASNQHLSELTDEQLAALAEAGG